MTEQETEQAVRNIVKANVLAAIDNQFDYNTLYESGNAYDQNTFDTCISAGIDRAIAFDARIVFAQEFFKRTGVRI